jgi:hypothetical protein
MHAEEQSLGDVYLRICKDVLEKSSCAVGKDVFKCYTGGYYIDVARDYALNSLLCVLIATAIFSGISYNISQKLSSTCSIT